MSGTFTNRISIVDVNADSVDYRTWRLVRSKSGSRVTLHASFIEKLLGLTIMLLIFFVYFKKSSLTSLCSIELRTTDRINLREYMRKRLRLILGTIRHLAGKTEKKT
jgi:hypothetical protein